MKFPKNLKKSLPFKILWYNKHMDIQNTEVITLATTSGLSINLDVIESMAAMAALEIGGVSSMAAKKVDIKKAFSGKPVVKPVTAEIKNGAVVINLHICVSKNFNAKQVAEEVQECVKERVQNMTSNAVTKINVYIAAVDLSEADKD